MVNPSFFKAVAAWAWDPDGGMYCSTVSGVNITPGANIDWLEAAFKVASNTTVSGFSVAAFFAFFAMGFSSW